MKEIEKEIIQWVARKNPDLDISSIVDDLKVSKREYTEIGFLTYFEPHSELNNIKNIEVKGFSNIRGPVIEASNLSEGAETLISTESGRIKYIEVFSIGEGNASEITSFILPPDNA